MPGSRGIHTQGMFGGHTGFQSEGTCSHPVSTSGAASAAGHHGRSKHRMGNVCLGLQPVHVSILSLSVNSELASKNLTFNVAFIAFYPVSGNLRTHCICKCLSSKDNIYCPLLVIWIAIHSVFKWLAYFRNVEGSGKWDMYVRWLNPFIFPFRPNPVCFLHPFHKVEHNASQPGAPDADLCLLPSEEPEWGYSPGRQKQCGVLVVCSLTNASHWDCRLRLQPPVKFKVHKIK